MHHAFVSYSGQDQAFVQRLTAAMHEAGRETWVDWERIPPSVKWLAEIYAAIDAADAVVFVVSPASVASGVCRRELDHALAERKRIVAQATAGVPPALAEINWINFAAPDDADALQRLYTTLDVDPAWVSRHTRLSVKAHEWDAGARNAAFLLRGQDLAEADARLASAADHGDPRPTDLQTAYLLASRAAQTRLQRRQTLAAARAPA